MQTKAMSGQGRPLIGAARADCGDAAEPNLKRRRLLDAGGPVEDDETARQKMRDAEVYERYEQGFAGFDPESVCQRLYTSTTSNETSPMGYFAERGDLPMMRWLYINGADTRDEDVHHWYPMYAAALHDRLEVCKWLSEHGASMDIKRRPNNGLSPLSVTFDEPGRRDVSRWLILNGALCKDDDSGDLDLGLVRKDLNQFRGCVEERPMFLEWANGQLQNREAFFVFLMGALPPPEYSPSVLRNTLLARLLSERATSQILESLSSDQHQHLWTNLIYGKERACPVDRLVGSFGVLEMIGDYFGVVRGREARIIRQLTEILPDLNVELDQKYEIDSSDEEDDSDSSEEE